MEPLVVARIEALSQLEADPSLAEALEAAYPGMAAGLLAERDTYRSQLGDLRSKQYAALAAAIASLVAAQSLRYKVLATLARDLHIVLLGRRQADRDGRQRALVTNRGQQGKLRHHLLRRVLHLLRRAR